MSYFIGIDGGGTKTALCCVDKKGKILATEDTRGTSYRQWGIDAVCTTLEEGVAALTKKAGIPLTAVAGIAMGAPCFGESQEGDRMLTQAVTRLFAPLAVLVVNDSAVGWAGSLALEEGINVVAGTGSIAFGRNSAGKTARCGGWDEFFSDEGSCYWLGKKTMEIFSKEADGRLPKGQVYALIRERFHLSNDYEFIQGVLALAPNRKEVAALQTILFKAALAGDISAQNAYRLAGEELVLLVKGVKNAILPEKACVVSYSGGLFHTGELILEPLRRELGQLGCVLKEPQFSPWVGAALLAVERFSPQDLSAVLRGLPTAIQPEA